MKSEEIEEILKHLVDSVELLLANEAKRIQSDSPAGAYDEDYSSATQAGAIQAHANELRKAFDRAQQRGSSSL
jgi:hypothetical protein